MSNYKAIREVNKRLREILWQEFTKDSEMHAIIGNEADIVFTNPTDTLRNESNRLSVWLYHITENDYLKNTPMIRAQGNGHDQAQFPPLALNLFYLVTPFAPVDNPEANLTLLGKTIEVLYDNSTILLQNADEELAQELRVLFWASSLEELTRIWDSLQQPYRLSVCYEVRVVQIASGRRLTQARVTERDTSFGSTG